MFPQLLDDRLQPQLVWLGQFRGGDRGCFDGAVISTDSRLNIGSPVLMSCECCSRNGLRGDENDSGANQAHVSRASTSRVSIVPAVLAELVMNSALKHTAAHSLHDPVCYEPSTFHRRALNYFGDVFLNTGQNASQGMLVDHELDKMTSGVKVEEEVSLFGGFLKGLGFDQPKKTSSSAGDKNDQYVDDGQGNTGSGGISGFFSGIANSVSDAVSAAAAVIVGNEVEQDDHKYLDDEAADLVFEEEDDAREKCCFCIPTTPKDQVKYIACNHKLSEYDKGEDDDPETYADKNERCEHSTRAHMDFWKCLQRINQHEPLPFNAPEADVTKRNDIELSWLASALGFSRYITRRKELMNRKRCSLKRGLREGTAKLLLQPPEPDMDVVMLLLTLVRRKSRCAHLFSRVYKFRRWEWRATCIYCTRRLQLSTLIPSNSTTLF
jgi:hypothetical protein